MRNRILSAAFISLAVMGGNVHAEEDGLGIVKREILGIMQEHGWKDVRIGQLSGSEGLFEIRDFSASRSGQGQSPDIIKIGMLTVENLSPEYRWTRAESLRAEDIKIVFGGNEVELDAIYSRRPGILDIDTAKPLLEFDNLIFSNALWRRGGTSFAEIEQVYLSADSWIGEYGVPGRLAATAKGLVMVPGASGKTLMPGEFALKTSVSAARDELSVVASFKAPSGDWVGSATLTNVDRNLFRAWFDRNNPEDERGPEDAEKLEEAFSKEIGEVGLSSFEFKGKGDGKNADPLFVAVSGVAQLWLPKVAGLRADELLAVFSDYAAKPDVFLLSGHLRGGVRVVDILQEAGEPLSKFTYNKMQ